MGKLKATNCHCIPCKEGYIFTSLTILHSERPKLYGVLAVLSAIGLDTNCTATDVTKIIKIASAFLLYQMSTQSVMN